MQIQTIQRDHFRTIQTFGAFFSISALHFAAAIKKSLCPNKHINQAFNAIPIVRICCVHKFAIQHTLHTHTRRLNFKTKSCVRVCFSIIIELTMVFKPHVYSLLPHSQMPHLYQKLAVFLTFSYSNTHRIC